MSETTKAGAMARRGDSSEHRAGDFIVGASKSVGDYTSSNKSRLGGAAGSTIGMVAGAALLGPVGLVAGSIAGGMALSNALKDKKATPSSEENTSKEDIDLLDTSTFISVSSSGTIQQQSMMAESRNATVSQQYHLNAYVSNQLYEIPASHRVQGHVEYQQQQQPQQQSGYSVQGQQSQYQESSTIHNYPRNNKYTCILPSSNSNRDTNSVTSPERLSQRERKRMVDNRMMATNLVISHVVCSKNNTM